MGGHSLLATQIGARLRDGFGVEMSLGEILGLPTVAELAVSMMERKMENLDVLDEGSLQELAAEIENLSEDELQSLPEGSNP